MEYRIRLDSFEGPFDLLFYLIEENRLDISTISLHKVAKQYLAYLNQMQEMDLDIASEFLLMAAELLQLKTKVLLPGSRRRRTQQAPEPDLVKRLIFYKKIRETTKTLRAWEEKGMEGFFRTPDHLVSLLDRLEEKKQFDEDPLKGIELEQLEESFKRALIAAGLQKKIVALKSKEKEIKWHEIEQDAYTVSEKMEEILNLCRQYPAGYEFTDTVSDTESRYEKVASFLALLELAKLQKVKILQEGFFAQITIRGEGDVHGKPN